MPSTIPFFVNLTGISTILFQICFQTPPQVEKHATMIKGPLREKIA
jgi:hypothetical protein